MADFELSRSTTIDAPPERVHAQVGNFRRWATWSPWEGLDPDLRRTYSGPDQGVGAHYAWSGNKSAGAGSMEIIESTPSAVVVDLEFLKPFKATNITRFDLSAAGAGATRVTWTMTGRRNPLMSVLGRLFFDKMIARDFERGLAQLKSVAEQPA